MSSTAANTVERAHPISAGIPLLQDLFDGSPVGLALFDHDLRYVWVNAALARMNGIGAHEHIGRRLHEVVPHLAEAMLLVFRRVLHTGEPVIDWELSGETAAHPGETRYRLLNICALRHAQHVVGLGAIVLDITDRRQAQRQAVEAEQHTSHLLHQLERALVPRAKVNERWQLAWHYQASENRMLLGGDFLGIHEQKDGILSLLIGDVTGRGAAAAATGAILRTAWLTSVHAGLELQAIPSVLDELLAGQTEGEALATACFAEIDERARELRLIRAGHDAPLLITPDATSALDADHGPLLGLSPLLGSRANKEWPLQRILLPDRAALILYTDGLTESRRTRTSPRLGLDGVIASIDRNRVLTQPPDKALDEVLQTALPPEPHRLRDDLAMIIVTTRTANEHRPCSHDTSVAGNRHLSASFPPAGLQSLSRQTEQQLFERYRQDHDPATCAELVRRFMPFARKLALHYLHSTEPLDDLVQVASLGLLNAVERFDPKLGKKFTSFAAPTITGELKRHFRDKGWSIHVPRDLQERALAVSQNTERLSSQLGRSPDLNELADAVGCTVEQVIEALDAAHNYHPASLDAPVAQDEQDHAALGDTLGHEDAGFELAEDRHEIRANWAALSDVEQQVLGLRLVHQLTQREISHRIGCSQMHVSRLLRRSMARLDPSLGETA
jgi:RNA polymerase sigma-B factor